jgi:hypothetical protein
LAGSALVSFALTAVLAANTGLAQQSAISAADAALRAGAFDRAANVLQQQAKAGDPEAQYRLASLYRLGRGVEQDEAAAFRWMKSAAERGHAEAQLNLAKMYLAGRGVAANVPEARAWLKGGDQRPQRGRRARARDRPATPPRDFEAGIGMVGSGGTLGERARIGKRIGEGTGN